jgi:hypothetical protein
MEKIGQIIFISILIILSLIVGGLLVSGVYYMSMGIASLIFPSTIGVEHVIFIILMVAIYVIIEF